MSKKSKLTIVTRVRLCWQRLKNHLLSSTNRYVDAVACEKNKKFLKISNRFSRIWCFVFILLLRKVSRFPLRRLRDIRSQSQPCQVLLSQSHRNRFLSILQYLYHIASLAKILQNFISYKLILVSEVIGS